MFDSFAGTLGLVVVAFMEMIAVVYIYGHKKWVNKHLLLMKSCLIKNLIHRFTEDIYQMTGYRPGLYWQITWRYVGPGLLAALVAASVHGYVKDSPAYRAWDPELVSVKLKLFIPRTLMQC
jgi:solute carrier family 6 amino acid/orphan transporter-like 15/16/17/18/20